MTNSEFKIELKINGETTLTFNLYNDEIDTLLGFVNELQDTHKKNIANMRESD